MEDINELLYNDTEAKFLALQKKKKNRKKRRRRFQAFFLLIVIVLGTFYFTSDASKVKSLDVSGNTYYTDDEVLSKAGLSYNTRYIVIPKLYIEWKLNKDELFESIEVKKSNGAISIQVKEKLIIGYFVKDDKNYILLADGTSMEIPSSNLTSIVHYPLIDGFGEEQLVELAKSFSKSGREITQDMIQMISEIHPYVASYDANMIRLVMQDGNAIYSDYASMPLLNDYKNVVLKNIKKGTKTKICVVMDDTTASLHTEDCAGFQ